MQVHRITDSRVPAQVPLPGCSVTLHPSPCSGSRPPHERQVGLQKAGDAQDGDPRASVGHEGDILLSANAAKYNLDPQRFAAFGQSAGANLAATLWTSCGVAALEGAELGNSDQSSCVQAVVDWFGPTDFLQMDKQFAGTSCPVNHDAANSPESMVIGAAIQTVPEKTQAANPITYVSAKAPPFLIQHGTADCNVPP
jgi:hypothetical protein